MAGALLFGGHRGVSLGTSFIDVIADYLKPYILEVGDKVVEQVYEVYDYYQTLSFDKLPPEEYMQCYKQIRKALKEDIHKISEFKPDRKKWLEEEWDKEIKPAMEQSPLFRKEL